MKKMSMTSQLLRKKLKDMKLSRKIRVFLFFITIATVLSVGLVSYRVAVKELLETSQTAVLALQKRTGRHLDDRIDSLRDLSYRILQSDNIQKLLTYTREEAIKNRTANEGLSAIISTHSSLSGYTEFAFLRPSSGIIYEYYRNSRQILEPEYRDRLLDLMEKLVDRHHITTWVVFDNQVYFVRQILSRTFQEQGILVLAVKDSFFDLFGAEMEYLKDDQVIILNGEHTVLKCSDEEIAADILSDAEEKRAMDYYIRIMEKTRSREKYTVIVLNTPKNGWTIISYLSHSVLLQGVRKIYRRMLEIMAAALFLVFLVTWLISKIITRNIVLIEEGLQEYELGHLNYRIRPASYDEIGLLALQLNYMAMRINELMDQLQIKEEEKRRLEIETLQAQINPHFLYNTLGSLKWEAYRRNQPELSASLDALIQLLRFTIKKADSEVSVREEIRYIENYVAIERMRYGDQFQVYYHIAPDAEDRMIPGFVLQPIVENCFLHGLDMSRNDGIIEISARMDREYLLLEVRDNGAGMSEQQKEALLAPTSEKKKKGLNSIGMNIVDKRLHEIYGDAYETEIISGILQGTCVTLKIPCTEGIGRRDLKGGLNELECNDRG